MTSKQEDRLRRFRATGRWFLPNKKDKTLWLNHVFPVMLFISLLFLILNM
jgi:hypothetical protein